MAAVIVTLPPAPLSDHSSAIIYISISISPYFTSSRTLNQYADVALPFIAAIWQRRRQLHSINIIILHHYEIYINNYEQKIW